MQITLHRPTKNNLLTTFFEGIIQTVIVDLADDYSSCMISVPDRSYMWILARGFIGRRTFHQYVTFTFALFLTSYVCSNERFYSNCLHIQQCIL
jgi:hypothetical protein